ncbi:Chitinase II [Fusarium oxysporum f. sp. vasinfectum]|nr:Chitinase II [Fusarium oxysporum f. sp. vasinfectum]
MYKRLTELKRLDPELKVYIVVGGWTFNDPGLTASMFSDLAASLPRQRAFMKSLVSFMSTYGFDGLDLDWEYLVDTDRGGRAEKTVDFFNIMSYDLHGAWDQGKNYTQPFLNAHSNLTEIDLALDLLWRNNIQSDKVVLGMGFYGRAFSVQSGTCTKPGCLFKAAGKAGDCSREKGILLNSEIVTTIKKYNIKPEFFKEEAVKVAKWGNQWVSYDDEDTFKLKTNYAKSRCLGGVMKAYEIKKIPNEQCRWTNCKEGCRKGWVPVPRSDSGARKNEIMFDETGCGGDGGHTFCCPAGSTKMPTCGWYGHNNGRCPVRSECPSDMTEIASNEIYCKKQKGSKKQNFQTACCKTDVVGTKVYGTCEWGQYPKCDAQEGYPNPLGNKKMGSLLAYSASGSGGSNCDDAKNELGLNVPGVQYCKFCYNDSDKNLRFTDCQKFRNVGPVDTCAIAGVGGMAHCCKTDYAEIFEVENPKIDAFENDVKAWIKNPTCPKDDGGLFKRFDPLNDTTMVSSLSMDLSPRAKEMEDSYDLVILLARLIAGLVSKEVAEALTPKWNLVVEEEYPNLVVRTLQEAKNSVPEWEDEDPEVMSRVTICDPKRANARIAAILGKGSDGRTLAFNCTNTICQNGVCEPFTPEAARRRRGLSTSRASHSAAHLHYHLHARQAGAEHNEVPLRDRGGGEATIEYNIPAHDEPKKLALRNPDAQVVDFANEADCHETKLWYTTWSVGLENMGFQTEHLIDKVILKRFFLDAGFGTPLDVTIRTVISLFEYMGSEEGDENGETVRTKINKIVNNIVNQLDHAQDLWNNEHPGRPVPAVKFFVEWLKDYFEEAGRLARAWLREAIAQLRERQRAASGARAEEIRLAIVSFESQMTFVRIVTDWDIPLLEDEDEMSTGSD